MGSYLLVAFSDTLFVFESTLLVIGHYVFESAGVGLPVIGSGSYLLVNRLLRISEVGVVIGHEYVTAYTCGPLFIGDRLLRI